MTKEAVDSLERNGQYRYWRTYKIVIYRKRERGGRKEVEGGKERRELPDKSSLPVTGIPLANEPMVNEQG